MYKKVDGKPKPPDFVSGESREELATMIQDLIESIGCEGGFPKKSVRDICTQQSISEEYKLEQNHPNPFNPLTTISYSLAEDCHVKISVYNSIGQLMTVLVDEMKSVGHHRVTWDVSNQGEIASGVYLYRLEAGDYIETKKMILMRLCHMSQSSIKAAGSFIP